MGIILMFFLVLLLLYATIGTRIAFYVLQLILVKWCGLDLSPKLLWLAVTLVFGVVSAFAILKIWTDSAGGTPDMSVVWRFFFYFNIALFVAVFFWRKF